MKRRRRYRSDDFEVVHGGSLYEGVNWLKVGFLENKKGK